jgi:hypothetical protein
MLCHLDGSQLFLDVIMRSMPCNFDALSYRVKCDGWYSSLDFLVLFVFL